MKKIFFIMISFLSLVACNNGDDDSGKNDEKLYLPTILSGSDKVITLTYDQQSRIVQLGGVANDGEYAELYTFYYSGDKLMGADAIYFSVAIEGGYNYTEKYSFEYDQNNINVKKEFLDSSGFSSVTNKVITIDDQGKLVSADGIEIIYDQVGNMVRVVENGNVTEISYDNRKGAFLNVKTPTWALYYVMKIGNFYRFNNPQFVKGYPVGREIEMDLERRFQYNESGYPIRFTEYTKENGDVVSEQEFVIDYLRIYPD